MNTLRTAAPQTREEELRIEQIEAGRRMGDPDAEPVARRTLHVVRPGYEGRAARPAPRNVSDSKRPPLKGHEAFLKALELSNADVVLEKLSGAIYKGKVKHSDKFTVTMRVEKTGHADGGEFQTMSQPSDRVVFKHDISEFYTTTAPRALPQVAEDVTTEEGHAV